MSWSVRVIMGSMSDAEQANKLLKLLKELGVSYRVSVASCHRNLGDGPGELGPFIESIKEEIIVFIGGMSLAAPGIIRAWLIGVGRHDRIVFAVPLDAAARSAIEDLPMGCPVITCGLNTVSVSHSITNSALAIAHMVATTIGGGKGLEKWYVMNRAKKPLIPEMEIVDGLIPIEKEAR